MRLWVIASRNETLPLEEQDFSGNCAKALVWSLGSPGLVQRKALSLASVSS